MIDLSDFKLQNATVGDGTVTDLSIAINKKELEEGLNEMYEKIKPTLFPIYSEKEQKIINEADFANDVFGIIKNTLVTREHYVQTGLRIFDIECECTSAVRKIIRYIAHCIEYESNAIKLVYSDVKKGTGLNKNDFFSGIRYLCETDTFHHILIPTTKQSLYIVDHNVIFKGSMERFIRDYVRCYKKGFNITEDGRIIIRDPKQVNIGFWRDRASL